MGHQHIIFLDCNGQGTPILLLSTVFSDGFRSVWSLGANAKGQLGVGDQNPRDSGIVRVEGFANLKVRQVRSAEDYNMAITGAIVLWFALFIHCCFRSRRCVSVGHLP